MKEIEEQIRQAIERGEFSDLPGKGKPLHLDENPLADPDWRLAHHVLRSSGFTLPWIEARQSIEVDLEKARADLSRAWAWQQASFVENRLTRQNETVWDRAVENFRQQIVDINKRIAAYNLQVPSEHLQRLPVNVERELEAVRTSQTPQSGGGQ